MEIIKGDLNDPASYQHHLQEIGEVFCNLSFNEGNEKEIRQGMIVYKRR